LASREEEYLEEKTTTLQTKKPGDLTYSPKSGCHNCCS